MNRVWIAFGSNQEQPVEQLLRARAQVADLEGMEEESASPLYQTPPVGFKAQDDFINAVIRYRCKQTPQALLQALLALELRLGRVRLFKNGPRVIDLDLLVFEGHILKTPTLTLPHPRMHERAFVLQPLATLDKTLRLGEYGTVAQCLARLPKQEIEAISKLTEPRWN